MNTFIDTAEITEISTESAEMFGLHFEWFGRHVNVVATEIDSVVDSFSFKEEPSYQQVLTACRGYVYGG